MMDVTNLFFKNVDGYKKTFYYENVFYKTILQNNIT